MMRFVFDGRPHDNGSDELLDIEDFFEDEMAEETDIDYFDEEDDI